MPIRSGPLSSPARAALLGAIDYLGFTAIVEVVVLELVYRGIGLGLFGWVRW